MRVNSTERSAVIKYPHGHLQRRLDQIFAFDSATNGRELKQLTRTTTDYRPTRCRCCCCWTMMMIMIMMRMERGGTAETAVTGAPRVTCQRVMSGRYSMKLCVGLQADRVEKKWAAETGTDFSSDNPPASEHRVAVDDKTTTTRCRPTARQVSLNSTCTRATCTAITA